MQDYEYDDLSETVKAEADIVNFAGKMIITVVAATVVTACIVGLILK